MNIPLHIVEQGQAAVKDYVDTYNRKEEVYGELSKKSREFYKLEDAISTEFYKQNIVSMTECYMNQNEKVKEVNATISRKMDYLDHYNRQLDLIAVDLIQLNCEYVDLKNKLEDMGEYHVN